MIEPITCPYCNKDVAKGHKVYEMLQVSQSTKGFDIKLLQFVKDHQEMHMFYICRKMNRVFGVKPKKRPEYREGVLYGLRREDLLPYEIVTNEL